MTAREFVRQRYFGTSLPPREVLRYLEAEMIEAGLEARKGNICALARDWQVHRNTITRKIRELADLEIITRHVSERKHYPRRGGVVYARTRAERLAQVGREVQPPEGGVGCPR